MNHHNKPFNQSVKKQAREVLEYLTLNISITDERALVECNVTDLPTVIDWLRTQGVTIYEKTYHPEPVTVSNSVLVYSLCDLEDPSSDCIDHAELLDCVHIGECSDAA